MSRVWLPINLAPRDGTIIEIKDDHYERPRYCLASFTRGELESLTGTLAAPAHLLSWRPYKGTVESYIDPTGGYQDTPEYIGIVVPKKPWWRKLWR